MFKNRLANEEKYVKDNLGNYDVASSFSIYEVYLEVAKDKEGNPLTNKDGSLRYYAVDDLSISTLKGNVKVKKINDTTFKKVYDVNGDAVEKMERDNKRVYFVVEEDRITSLDAGTEVIARGEFFRIPNEKGYVIVDEKDIEHPRTVYARKFKTDNHEEEAKKIVKNFQLKPKKE